MPARSVTKAKAPTFAAVVNRPMGALDHNLNRGAGKAQPPHRFSLALRDMSRYAGDALARFRGVLVLVTYRYAAASALCGTLVACAGSPAPPSTRQLSRAGSAAPEQATNTAFASVTWSP